MKKIVKNQRASLTVALLAFNFKTKLLKFILISIIILLLTLKFYLLNLN
jgi:hypothetical protein